MKLTEMKKSYSLAVSLGSSCSPAAHLRRCGLRRFSMPLDWVVSNNLTDVNRLLVNRFQGFMELGNMRVINGTANSFDEETGAQTVKSYFVEDTGYNIISIHDFPIVPGHAWYEPYPAYKKKLDMRINRFLTELASSPSLLFVRWAARYEEVIELRTVLSQLTANRFEILVLCPTDEIEGVVEANWEMDKVCAVKVPNRPADLAVWDHALKGVTVRS